MPTLKDKLLDGKVIGETFNIYNPEMLGENPVENYHYKVKGLKSGAEIALNYVDLVVEGQDGIEHDFPIAFRLDDIFIPSEQISSQQVLSRADAEDIFIDRL